MADEITREMVLKRRFAGEHLRSELPVDERRGNGEDCILHGVSLQQSLSDMAAGSARAGNTPSPTRRVLVTGFEPFGAHPFNPSAALVDELASHYGQRADLRTAILPTAFALAGAQIRQLLEASQPDVVLHLGLAATRTQLSLERFAKNLDDCPNADNSGEVRRARVIERAAPERYASTLTLEPLASCALEHGEELRLSDDAGGFVCNHVLFSSLHWARKSGLGTRVGFVHLPHLEPGSPRLHRVGQLLRAWLELLWLD